MSTPRTKATKKHALKHKTSSSGDGRSVDGYEESSHDEKSLDSDALDESDDGNIPRKRKRGSRPVRVSPKKGRTKRRRKSDGDGDDEGNEEFELEDGQEIVGPIMQASKTGKVPAGQISLNTFDFLSQLQDPSCNDREWFKLHAPIYRGVEQEWKYFVEEFTHLITVADPQIPPLPPKDVIHRIYRDVLKSTLIRFSNDKTPYKTNLSAGFSRSGRKGIFAQYYVQIKPSGGSFIAAGLWCPGKNELATIRSHILHNPTRLRKIISSPKFVKHFGEPKPHPKGQRRNIFGRDDELKVAPKGIDKEHKDIDLLKCRSFGVQYMFTDEQVLSPTFKEELAKMVKLLRPFVHCLNDYMTLPTGGDSGDEEDDDDDGEDEGDENGDDE